jgi:hypothetical protein
MPEEKAGPITAPLCVSGLPDTSNAASSESAVSSDRLVKRWLGKTKRLLWYALRKTSYLVFLVLAVIVLLVGAEKAAKLALSRSHLAYVYPDDPEMAKRDYTQAVSHYDYDLTPGACLTFNQLKGNRYEYANNAGFRDPRSISTAKPADEYRIFLTGGSTAFGLGASGQAGPVTHYYYLEHRETIAHMLERILNATAPIPGKKIRVYNAAVWGYSYQHLLFRYLTKLRRYKPDMIVSLDGVNEIGAVSVPDKDWDYFRQGQYNRILRQVFSYDFAGLRAYTALWFKNNTFLMTLWWKGISPFDAIGMRMHEGAPVGPEQTDSSSGMSREERSRILQDNVSTVVKVVEDYHSALENDGVRHIFALQPLLYLSKKPRHDWEKQVEPIGDHNQYFDAPAADTYAYMRDQIAESARRKQYFLVDFTEYFDDTSEWVFTDWCHLTAGANFVMAKALANVIKESFFKMSLTEADRGESKDAFFRNPMLSATVVYAPPSDDDGNGPRNILTGFPSAAVYSSKPVATGERLEIVVDLNSPYNLSRSRLVWDNESVPDQWSVDVSLDGTTWTQWIQGGNKDVDNFSWWPGYEFYGAEPVQARFLRYKPTAAHNRSIRLRSWNVYR